MQEDNEAKPNIADVKLEHRHNYVGGAFAYKNSSSSAKMLDPENFQETVMMIGRGKARPVRIAAPDKDLRSGSYPQHNSPHDFRQSLELIESKSLEAYSRLNDVHSLEENAYKHLVVPFPRERMARVHAQYAHLSKFAFNQMLGIPNPDKRDFDVWVKKIEKTRQLIIAYPYKKTGVTIFVQVVDLAEDLTTVVAIKHCTFDEGAPIVINESALDKFSNVRQIAHLGVKGASKAYNSVERFDDGSVTWTVTIKSDNSKTSGTAVLKLDDSVEILHDEVNEASKLAAKNLGAEGVELDKWSGVFDPNACSGLNDHPMQTDFKETVRRQIGQIIDGATIPGFVPIFPVHFSHA